MIYKIPVYQRLSHTAKYFKFGNRVGGGKGGVMPAFAQSAVKKTPLQVN